MTKFENPPLTSADEKPKKTILSLQVLRGIAAIAVAIYHTHLILAQQQYGGIDVFGAVSSKGWLGVNLFFVLSGFIILFAHVRDVGVPGALPNYFWKRFSRVYPVYWIFTTVYIVAASRGIGYADFEYTPLNLVSVYALVQVYEPLTLPLKVAWTLFYEVTFYILFAVFLVNLRLGIVVFAIWLGSILISSLVFGRAEMGPLHMWNAYFFIGMLLYPLYRVMDARWGIWLLSAGVVLLGLMVWDYAGDHIGEAQKDPLKILVLSLPFALIVLGSLQMEVKYRWTPPKLLLVLGDATFAIYLVHSAVISLIALLHHKLKLGIQPELLFVFTAVASIVAGVIAHFVVEKPLLNALRSRRISSLFSKPAPKTEMK